jgi:hypothetical protein
MSALLALPVLALLAGAPRQAPATEEAALAAIQTEYQRFGAALRSGNVDSQRARPGPARRAGA